MAERKEAANIQSKEREGDIMSRQMEADKTKALMGMAADEYSSAQQAVAQADQKMWSGITSAAGAAAGGISNAGGLSNMFGGGAGGGNIGGGVGGFDMSNMTMAEGFEGGLPEGLSYSLAGDYDQQHLYTNDPNQ